MNLGSNILINLYNILKDEYSSDDGTNKEAKKTGEF
jgi:hypothetical protein